MNKILGAIVAIPLAIITSVCWSFLMAFLVMWLWNWLLPGLFWHATMKINIISYWQAWGLLILSQLLIKGEK